MGGFLGIGRGKEQKLIDDEATFKKQEIARAENERAVRLAERKAKKGQATANIKLGSSDTEIEEEETLTTGKKSIGVSSSLGLGGNKRKSGVQL